MKNTKKLAGAIAALAVSAALATGTTYAWFASNGVATVESFNAEVTTKGNNLLVAACASGTAETDVTVDESSEKKYLGLNYKYTLSAEDIWAAILGLTNDQKSSLVLEGTNANLSNYSDIKLDALTTASTVTTVGTSTAAKAYGSGATASSFGLYKNDKNDTTEGNNTLTEVTGSTSTEKATTYIAASGSGDTATAKSKATGSYLTFDLVFRTDVATNLVLTQNSKVEAPTGDNSSKIYAWEKLDKNKYGTHDDIAKDSAIGARAANAVRVAFANVHAPSGTDGKNKYWAPNEYYVNGAASGDIADTVTNKPKVNSSTGLEISSTAAGSDKNYFAGYYKGNLAGDFNKYVGVYTNYVDKQVAFDKGLSLISDTSTEISNDSDSVIGTFSSSDGAKYMIMTVYIWIEGTDGDCFDDVLGDAFSCFMEFKALNNESTTTGGEDSGS